MAKSKGKAKGAKVKKGGAPLPPKDKAAKVRPGDVEQLINAKQLRSLLASDDTHKEEIDGVVGSLREKIAYAVKHHHLDKKAYGYTKQFNRMSAEKLADLWPRLLAYMDMAGLMERIDSVERLPLGDDAETEDETESSPARPGPKFGGPAERVAEIAQAAGAQQPGG